MSHEPPLGLLTANKLTTQLGVSSGVSPPTRGNRLCAHPVTWIAGPSPPTRGHLSAWQYRVISGVFPPVGPRMRYDDQPCLRCIPACAGETVQAHLRVQPVYPRMRGGTAVSAHPGATASVYPRLRGGGGGGTRERVAVQLPPQVYPRLRGGNSTPSDMFCNACAVAR